MAEDSNSNPTLVAEIEIAMREVKKWRVFEETSTGKEDFRELYKYTEIGGVYKDKAVIIYHIRHYECADKKIRLVRQEHGIEILANERAELKVLHETETELAKTLFELLATTAKRSSCYIEPPKN